MITNYIKTALRNFYRNRSITLIKILGLAIGLAVTFFILIYISTETSYNDNFLKKEKIYRVNQQNYLHNWKTMQTSFPFRDELINDYPEIELATRIIHLYDLDVKMNDQIFSENHLVCVDKSFFDMFTTDRLNGDFSMFADNNYQVVITESMAKKYFGTINVINEPLKIKTEDNEYVLNVIAIIKDLPHTSTIKFDFIAHIELGLEQANNILTWSDGIDRNINFYRTDWETNFLETYILLKNGKNVIGFDQKLKNFEAKHLRDTTERDYYLQNLGDIYLHSKDIIGSGALGDLNSIYIFSAIAFLVLLIACINYIILSISQIITRTKEIGIRKITGANQSDLFKQISIESLIVILFTIPLSFILIEQFRPVLENIIEKQIIMTYNLKFVLGFISVIIFVIFIPGLNIVYYLNRISPISILGKELHKSVQRFNLRKILIIIQFVIFIVLVVLALGIRRQLGFSTRDNLGFNPYNKIVVQVKELVKGGKYQTLKDELLKNPDITNVSGAMWLPPSNGRMSLSYSDSNIVEPIKLEALFVDKDFIETFGLNLISGKSLSEFETNSNNKIVVNEEAAQLIGEDNLIGRRLWSGEIVGIVNNFRIHSVHEKIQPMILVVGDLMIREMVVSFVNGKSKSQKLLIESQIQKIYPDMNVESEILIERFDTLYKKEKRLGLLITIFSFLAIFIASIGLLGLTIFTTKKQSKNIAIRKVNGASSLSILKMLLNDYIKLIFIAFLIAVPISYYLLNAWLQNFAYRMNIEWWLFIIAGFIALIITIITIGWYSLKAARRDPVHSLRYE